MRIPGELDVASSPPLEHGRWDREVLGQTTLSKVERVVIERRYANVVSPGRLAPRAANELVGMLTRSALIARKQLDPHEEARAVQAMLEDGLSEDGAAQALGWPKARVTARMKLLELPARARELVGAGVVALSAVDQLRAIGKVSPALLEALIEYLCDGNEWAGERLAREPGWVLDSALRETATKVFVGRLDVIDDYDIAELKLGKKASEQYAEASELHKQLDRYAYGAPRVRFSD